MCNLDLMIFYYILFMIYALYIIKKADIVNIKNRKYSLGRGIIVLIINENLKVGNGQIVHFTDEDNSSFLDTLSTLQKMTSGSFTDENTQSNILIQILPSTFIISQHIQQSQKENLSQ